ncbi:hypothetical protein LY13_005103, partial [Prauserella aidingensis]|nr:hypothetical protein [Prauserella aidingensis]
MAGSYLSAGLLATCRKPSPGTGAGWPTSHFLRVFRGDRACETAAPEAE